MNRIISIACLLMLFTFLSTTAHTQQNRSPIRSYENAVFQRGAPIVINGRTKTTQGKVTIEFNGQKKQTHYHNRRFKVEFPAMKAGGPYELKVTDADGEHIAKEIYVGDIWVCVGQSNMMFPMTKMHKKATWEPAKQDSYPLVRVKGRNGWQRATDINVIKNMPGTPYYFARHLNRELGIAIGLQIAGAGGTSLWQWTPTEAHESPELAPFYEVMKARLQFYKDGKLPKKAGIHDYPKAKGFSSQRYPYFPKKGYADPGLINIETWAGKVPSRGIVFWQGENDIGMAANYEHLFRTLITRYQKNAGREFPFIFIQLPTYSDTPGGKTKYDGITGLRDAQRRVAESDPTVEMVVTYDIYSRGIHPSKKQEYGTRLANAVLGKVYEKDVKWIHGKYDKIEMKGNKLLVHFKDVGSGLKTKDGKAPMDFTIAGADQKFYKATAKLIDKDTIELSAAEVSSPVAVRYAWQNSPRTNLIGDGDLPVSPFRSDDWELYPVE